jgi:hypothetical protein
MDGKSRWTDNIMIECWFRSFKYEEAYADKDRKAFGTDLKTIYQTADEKKA